MLRRSSVAVVLLAAVCASLTGRAFGDVHTAGVPELSSRPGAAYTIYLDFAGFNFTGTWGGAVDGKTPGDIPAYNGLAATDTFSSTDQTNMSNMWASIANAYASFDVNVTTIDPAVAGLQADTDALRQAYYDSQARMVHTIFAPSNEWYGPAGGVAFTGLAPNSYSTAAYNSGAGRGYHTNWEFINGAGVGHSAASAAAHEDGHSLALSHQSDYQGSTLVNAYSKGDNNNRAAGSYGPMMGVTYYTQRGAWRVGQTNKTSAPGSIQDDVEKLAGISGMTMVEDGVGHTITSATALPLTGSTVDTALAQGVINPLNVLNAEPIGIDNYSKDYWSFTSDGMTPISLTVWDGNDFLTTGVQDMDPTLRSILNIWNGDGSLYGTATEAANTLSETFSATLPAGAYFAEVTSYGGHTQTLSDGAGGFYNTTYYYDMGGYFMTGSGFASAVPEPASMAVLGLGVVMIMRRRRK